MHAFFITMNLFGIVGRRSGTLGTLRERASGCDSLGHLACGRSQPSPLCEYGPPHKMLAGEKRAVIFRVCLVQRDSERKRPASFRK